MTKTLSQMLGAREPAFRLGLKQLEQASGGAAEDIRLTYDISRRRQTCLRDLGLDPQDTTAPELYAALMERVRQDSRAFDGLLTGGQSGGSLMPKVERLVRSLDVPMRAFSLRPAVAKRLLRKQPPKRTLKQLGYRSIESVLKHEPCALLLAAAVLAEPAGWRKALLAEYKKLTPSDFESRDIQVIAPDSQRWQTFSQAYVTRQRHNVLAFRELGAVVLLPLEAGAAPRGAALAAALLTLQAFNDIRAASTYLKLQLVRPDFGAVVSHIAQGEPLTRAEMVGVRLPWKLVHCYFARHPDAYDEELFQPHVHQEDLQWQAAEDALAQLHPRFEFWHGASFAGLLERGELVSLNLIDAVVNYCNGLPFERRMVRTVRGRLWHELLLRYMYQPGRQPGIGRAVHEQLGYESPGAAAF